MVDCYPKVRIYGDFADCCSWGRVAAGMAIGLQANGALGGTCQIRDLSSESDGMPEVGVDSDVAIYVGPPTHMGVLKSVGNHRERLLFVAANSTWLPDEMMRHASKVATGILAPSSWARLVVRNQGYGLACYSWHHGVDEVFAPPEEPAPDPETYKVLHMTSTMMERKSTNLLIEAWGNAVGTGRLRDAKLTIVSTNPKTVAKNVLDAAKRLGVAELLDTVSLMGRKNLSTWRAARFYAGYDAVCQPSRAEGFGLVPLEARACGLPAIMTRATGHFDHATGPGVVVVPHGPYGPIDDGPGATAPTVSVADVKEALIEAYENRKSLARDARGHAEQIRAEWSWPRVTKRWLRSMFYAGQNG